MLLMSPVAQRVKCWTCNQQVVGSNLARGKKACMFAFVVFDLVFQYLAKWSAG